MNGLALLLAASALGVDYGWRPHEDGGLEYIIQIEPEVFASLENGGDILSEIHPQARDVRRFRIRIGRGPLPREGGELALAADDGPLPPAPLDTTTPATSISEKKTASASPPLNHVAQGSGYGSPFGGYGRSGTYSGAGASGASNTAGTYGTTGASGASPGSSSYTTPSTSPSYGGSSRTGYSDYGGSSRTGAADAASTSSDPRWSGSEVRTASNQQPVAQQPAAGSSTSATGATPRSTSTGSTPAQSTGSGLTASNGPGNSTGQATGTAASQPGYGSAAGTPAQIQTTTNTSPPAPAPAMPRSPAADQHTYGAGTGLDGASNSGAANRGSSTGAADPNLSPAGGAGSQNHGSQGYGPLTPVSSNSGEAPNAPPAAPNGSNGSTSAAGGVTNGNSSPSAGGGNYAQPDNRGTAPPPAYPQGHQYNGGYANPAPGNPYANPPYSYNTPAAPPVLSPPAQAPNYGYPPAGVPGYSYGQPGPGYGYGQTPGYYGTPPLAPPTLATSPNNSSGSSSRSRYRDDEDDEERDYRERRAYSPPPVAASPPEPTSPTTPPAPQSTIAGTEPWLAFTVTILLLFASVGGNIYLLWISQDFYWRYKELANDLRTFNSAAS